MITFLNQRHPFVQQALKHLLKDKNTDPLSF